MSEKKREKPVSRLAVVIIIALVIAGINYLSYPLLLDIKLAAVAVPVARQTLSPYQQISAEDIVYVQMPKTYLDASIITDSSEIVGKYVRADCTVAANAFFYQDLIATSQQAEGSSGSQLQSRQMAYSLAVDDIASTNDTLVNGGYVDLYFKDTRMVNGISKAVIGLLCEKVCIKGLYGTDSTPVTGSGHIRYIVVALDEEQLDYVMRAAAIGQIQPVIRRNNDETFTDYYSIALTKAYIDQWSEALRK